MIPALVFAAALSAPTPIEVKIPGSLVTVKMVPLPAGKFKGQDIKGFAIGQTEVTWDVYDIFAYRLDMTQEQQAAGVEAKTRPSKPYGAPDRGYGHKDYPAIGVHSNAAKAFVEWMSRKTGKTFRLPTEAEWEYAAVAGGSAPLPKLEEAAWFWDTVEDKTMDVGKKKPNAWGLYDMLGNAAEWTIAPDGTPVTRGGHFLSKAKDLSPETRQPYDPKWQRDDAQIPKSSWWLSNGQTVGLRLAMTL
jgi:formylglycine-generating enzyme required for sulfatase activity